MKIIRVLIVLLVVLFSSQINLFAQNEVKDTNQFALNAISKAVIQFHQQKDIGLKKYMVICMKIMKISGTNGEFVLSYIFTDYNYRDLNPTHYVCANNELVLIINDTICKEDPAKFGINKITKTIQIEAFKLLLGPNVHVTGEDPAIMVFKYEKDKLEGKFHDRYTLPAPDKKYWF